MYVDVEVVASSVKSRLYEVMAHPFEFGCFQLIRIDSDFASSILKLVTIDGTEAGATNSAKLLKERKIILMLKEK